MSFFHTRAVPVTMRSPVLLCCDTSNGILKYLIRLFFMVVIIGIHMVVVLGPFKHRCSVSDDEKRVRYLNEHRRVRIRRPQDHIRAMHILEEGPPVTSAHFHVEADLQEPIGG